MKYNENIKTNNYIKEDKYPIDYIDKFNTFNELCEKLISINEINNISSKIIEKLSKEEKDNFYRIFH
jgi:hypothetical protein